MKHCVGAHPGGLSAIYMIISDCSTRRTLYAHSATGSPTNADRTNHPDGGSALALGCSRRPVNGLAARRVLLVMVKGGSELEIELVIENA